MELILIGIVSLGTALLTFFSGFGLGTILMPVFALFFPLELAIALTAVVHLLNNLFKITLVWKNIEFKIALLFGVPAMFGAFVGAWLLGKLSASPNLISYVLLEKEIETNVINLVVAALLVSFCVFELNKQLANFSINKKYLPFGGILSGFFGGISGHQGALRSVFLLKAGLSKTGFIATGITIAIAIDVARISVYGSSFLFQNLNTVNNGQSIIYVVVACLSAFIGTYFGKTLLKKVTIRNVQVLVSIMLLLFAVLLGLGII
jgi:uncharacterized membrane protein YfcA